MRFCFVILLLASGCGAAAKGIPHVAPDDNPGDAVTSSPSPPESPGLPSASVPGGPGGGGGPMPQH
jgi:hypothetical protein